MDCIKSGSCLPSKKRMKYHSKSKWQLCVGSSYIYIKKKNACDKTGKVLLFSFRTGNAVRVARAKKRRRWGLRGSLVGSLVGKKNKKEDWQNWKGLFWVALLVLGSFRTGNALRVAADYPAKWKIIKCHSIYMAAVFRKFLWTNKQKRLAKLERSSVSCIVSFRTGNA